MKKILPLIFSVFILSAAARSQAGDVPVILKVIDNKKDPLPYASVMFVNRIDSTQKFQRAADSMGVVHIRLPKNNQFTVSVTAVGYTPFEKTIQVTESRNNFTLTATAIGKTM